MKNRYKLLVLFFCMQQVILASDSVRIFRGDTYEEYKAWRQEIDSARKNKLPNSDELQQALRDTRDWAGVTITIYQAQPRTNEQWAECNRAYQLSGWDSDYEEGK